MDVPGGYVIGDWTVGRQIGAGQFGSVYAAVRTRDELTLSDPGPTADPPRRAAIKVTRALTGAGRDGLRRCMDADRALRERGRTPWAVRIDQVIDLEDDHLPHLDGATAVVMDLAAGNLEDLIGRPKVNVERLLVDTMRAVAGMHEFVAGYGSVFHGDLKPSNVLVFADGGVRIGDLDLVQATEGTHLDGGARPGTRDYLPPEVFAGEPLVRRTHDVWAVGVITHRVLSGGAHPIPAVDGSRAAGLAAYAAGSAELQLDDNLDRFPPVWRTVVRTCLEPDRLRRAEVSLEQLIEQVLDGSPGSRRAATPLEPPPVRPAPSPTPPAPVPAVRPRPVRGRARWPALVLGGLVAAAVGAAAGQLLTPGAVPGPELGRVQSNAGFGGADACGGSRTVGRLVVRSCIHHTANGYYGGLIIHSASDQGERVEAEWTDFRLTAGGVPQPAVRSRQAVILDPDDTITVLTTPRVERVDGCVASSGYLLLDRTIAVRSPFKDTAAVCAPPPGWPADTPDDPPPPRLGTAIPDGLRPRGLLRHLESRPRRERDPVPGLPLPPDRQPEPVEPGGAGAQHRGRDVDPVEPAAAAGGGRPGR